LSRGPVPSRDRSRCRRCEAPAQRLLLRWGVEIGPICATTPRGSGLPARWRTATGEPTPDARTGRLEQRCQISVGPAMLRPDDHPLAGHSPLPLPNGSGRRPLVQAGARCRRVTSVSPARTCIHVRSQTTAAPPERVSESLTIEGGAVMPRGCGLSEATKDSIWELRAGALGVSGGRHHLRSERGHARSFRRGWSPPQAVMECRPR
jgi:hypothetical protein